MRTVHKSNVAFSAKCTQLTWLICAQVTKLSLTPPSSVDDVAIVVAAAAASDLDVDVSTRTTRRVLLDTSDGIRTLDKSQEYNVEARFVDGSDAIKAAAAGKVALWNSGV